MSRAAEKHTAPRHECLGTKIRIGLEVAHVGDKKLDLFTIEAVPEPLPVIHLQRTAYLGIGRDKSRHGLWNQIDRRHRVAAEAHFTGVELGHACDLMAEPGGALHQAQGMSQHHLAFWRGAQILVGAVDQHAAELLFQPLNTAAERRLSNTHGVGGAHKAAVLIQRDEVAQLAKIHGMPASLGRIGILGAWLIPSTKLY
ncbi:hypothetical protein PFWH6_0221 [Pseudomonas fluorescens WH6]|nr:hypothetical protein PFWH6_0221 [Pseudomonas fluorescens WH6]